MAIYSLATLALAVHKHGAIYASVEGEFMLGCAVAFFIDVSLARRLMMRRSGRLCR
jgi:hypothetical protein